MPGKKSEPSWQISEIQRLAEDRFISSVRSLGGAKQACFLSLSSDLVYEMGYQLSWWQWLTFPILSCRLHRLKKSIKANGLQNTADCVALRKTVAQLEFGRDVPPPHLLPTIRFNIVQNEFNNWQIRQAFNSCALEVTKHSFVLKSQPRGLHAISVVGQWGFGVISGFLFCQLAYDAFISPCLSIPSNYYGVLTISCFFATSTFYRLGAQWREGYATMQSVWPTQRAHHLG